MSGTKRKDYVIRDQRNAGLKEGMTINFMYQIEWHLVSKIFFFKKGGVPEAISE